jgi:tetratricopeptide (TPR) repeat protein
LRVPGEVVWRVPPLAIDDAVTLFTQRADAAMAGTEPTDRDHAVVAKLCERVDGMPLAIELLAARTSAFTVGQLAERLDDRFRLLAGGARTALPRHQTLRAVTDWSYDLLFDDERTVFERLAVFVGGCTLEAAEAVCSDDELAPADVGALVGRLVDKSLVVADGSGRYRLLLTLTEYARRRLEGHGAGAVVGERHAAYHAELAERSRVDWQGPHGRTQVWWLARLGTELDNLRAALEWSITRGDAETSQLLAGNLGWYWVHAGRAVEGHHWIERALGCGGPTPPRVRAPALSWAAWLALQAGRSDVATRRAVEAIELGDEVADFASLGLAWTVRFQLALLEGSTDLAATCLDRGQEADDAVDDAWHHGLAAMMRSLAADLRGQRESAEREAVRAIDTFRVVGDICTLVPMLHEHSRMLQSAGRFEAAEAAVLEARDVSESFGLRGWQPITRSRLGSLAMLRGHAETAAEHYRAAADLAHDLALPHAELAALEGLARTHHRNGDHATAQQYEDAAQAITLQLERTAVEHDPDVTSGKPG